MNIEFQGKALVCNFSVTSFQAKTLDFILKIGEYTPRICTLSGSKRCSLNGQTVQRGESAVSDKPLESDFH